MDLPYQLKNFLVLQRTQRSNKTIWARLHIDLQLLTGLLLLSGIGLLVLYSASSQSSWVMEKQLMRLGIAFATMWVFAFTPPSTYKRLAPFLFIFGVILLLVVLITGHVGKGAQRWLDLGLFRFQPSEILKLALPMMLAWYFSEGHIPPNNKSLFFASILIIVPMFLIAKQPDLGTAIIIAAAGFSVLLLAGISLRLVLGLVVAGIASTPILWHFMHSYQRQRLLTFLYPESDPLGSGYHIIQSKIAIGSGGIFGKGWLNGTQSHLQFLPEHSTDFIYAVLGEEFGLIGGIILLFVYLFIVGRGLRISSQAQDTFCRLLGGSLILTFFASVLINIGMVTGLLPVVGVPLPLISYGGSSMVTMMASFGIMMSIH